MPESKKYGITWGGSLATPGRVREHKGLRGYWEVSRHRVPSVTSLTPKCSKERHKLLLVGTSAAEEFAKVKSIKITPYPSRFQRTLLCTFAK